MSSGSRVGTSASEVYGGAGRETGGVDILLPVADGELVVDDHVALEAEAHPPAHDHLAVEQPLVNPEQIEGHRRAVRVLQT